MTKVTKGSCNCGEITWEATGEMREIVACHCSQCRKQTGLYYAATNVADDCLTVHGESLTWYQSSPEAKRGFCNICGSALFWKRYTDDFTSILVGSIDGDSGLEIDRHIFTADKPDWYDITDGKPQN
ncbi:MAG: GFA family protein [Pseudomonadota bacterium]